MIEIENNSLRKILTMDNILIVKNYIEDLLPFKVYKHGHTIRKLRQNSEGIYLYDCFAEGCIVLRPVHNMGIHVTKFVVSMDGLVYHTASFKDAKAYFCQNILDDIYEIICKGEKS